MHASLAATGPTAMEWWTCKAWPAAPQEVTVDHSCPIQAARGLHPDVNAQLYISSPTYDISLLASWPLDLVERVLLCLFYVAVFFAVCLHQAEVEALQGKCVLMEQELRASRARWAGGTGAR